MVQRQPDGQGTEFASKYHVPLQKVTFRKTYTRWCSYSDENNLNLSLHLATLPDHLIDYVILHELAHHKIRNHSKTYWMHLGTMIDDPVRLDRGVEEVADWGVLIFGLKRGTIVVTHGVNEK